jgi:hypothetical protein
MHNGTVSPATKHIINASCGSAAVTSMPATLLLVDLLGYYPMSTVTAAGDQATIMASTFTAVYTTGILTHAAYDIASFTRVQVSNSGGALPSGLVALTDYWTIRQGAGTSKLASSYANAVAGTAVTLSDNGSGTNTITSFLPRYTTGAGVQCYAVAPTALGAYTPNFRITYTNTTPTAGQLTPGTLPVGKSGAIQGHIPYSGTGAGKYGPFMPLAAGDKGIQSIQQLNIASTYGSGTLAYCLCKPLLYLPMTTIGVYAERDLLNQLPSLPRVYDGACLAWLMYAGAATPVSSGFAGHLDFGWN